MLTRTELKSDRMSESMRAFWPADTSGSGEIEKKKGQILAYVWKSTSHSVLYIPRLLAKSFFGDECWIFENGVTGLKKTKKTTFTHSLIHITYTHWHSRTCRTHIHTHRHAHTPSLQRVVFNSFIHLATYLSCPPLLSLTVAMYSHQIQSDSTITQQTHQGALWSISPQQPPALPTQHLIPPPIHLLTGD